MLDLPFLRTTIHEAVDGLVDRVVDLMPEPRAVDETARVSSLVSTSRARLGCGLPIALNGT